jgi:hypothetical protein
MTEAYNSAIIGIWAWLWVHHLTRPDEVFNVVRRFVSERTQSPWIRKPTIDCAKCHAGQIAIIAEGYRVYTERTPPEIEGIILAIFVATILEKWK